MSLPWWRGWLPLSAEERERVDAGLLRLSDDLSREREYSTDAAWDSFARAKGAARWIRAYRAAATDARSARALLALIGRVPNDSDYPTPELAMAEVERIVLELYDAPPPPPSPQPAPVGTVPEAAAPIVTEVPARAPSLSLAAFGLDLLGVVRDPEGARTSPFVVDEEPWRSSVLADIALSASVPPPMGLGMEVVEVDYRAVTSEPWAETVHGLVLTFRFYPSMDDSLPPERFDLAIEQVALVEGRPRIATLVKDEAARDELRRWAELVKGYRAGR